MSPNYATELQSGPAKGVELDDVIREVGVAGIVNGMDVTEWDPSEDKFLDAKYDITNVSVPIRMCLCNCLCWSPRTNLASFLIPGAREQASAEGVPPGRGRSAC